MLLGCILIRRWRRGPGLSRQKHSGGDGLIPQDKAFRHDSQRVIFELHNVKDMVFQYTFSLQPPLGSYWPSPKNRSRRRSEDQSITSHVKNVRPAI